MRWVSWMAIFLSATMLLSSYGPRSIAGFVLTAFGLIITFVLLILFWVAFLSERKQIKNEEKSPRLKIVLFLILGLGIFAGLVFAGYKLGQKQVSSPQPTPTSNPAVNWKTYKNLKYGFELIYPAKGVIPDNSCSQKGGKCDYHEGECGKAIKETSDYILVDNLFKIQILDWPKSIDDYLIQRGAKNKYDFEQIQNSNADEAIKVVQIKKGLELVAVGYPPLMNISYLYKKSDRLFIIENFQDENNGGCINPKNLDHVKFPKFANQNWDVKDSFKFTF